MVIVIEYSVLRYCPASGSEASFRVTLLAQFTAISVYYQIMIKDKSRLIFFGGGIQVIYPSTHFLKYEVNFPTPRIINCYRQLSLLNINHHHDLIRRHQLLSSLLTIFFFFFKKKINFDINTFQVEFVHT